MSCSKLKRTRNWRMMRQHDDRADDQLSTAHQNEKLPVKSCNWKKFVL